jgi:VIT1/CCC1 family predicted Fe2+/Mn2+ transporter
VELREKPRVEFLEVKGILESYGLESEDAERITSALQSRPDAMIDFMMRFELGLEQPRQGRAWKSALTIAAAYIAGGLVPLLPYMFESSARHALTLSTVVTLSALGIFGYVKGRFTGSRPVRSLLQTMAIGSLAAGAAFLIARAVNG